MARNVPISVDDIGPVVAVLNGRGDLVGTIQPNADGTATLRLDDMSKPEFWAEIRIDLTALQQRLKEIAEQEEVVDVTEADVIGD